MSKPVYTLSVQGRFGLGWTQYRVTNHQVEPDGNGAWLVLTLLDGSTITVPGIDKRPFRVHADYAETKGEIQGLKLIAQEELDRVRQEALAAARQEVRAAVAAATPPQAYPSRPVPQFAVPPLNGIAQQ